MNRRDLNLGKVALCIRHTKRYRTRQQICFALKTKSLSKLKELEIAVRQKPKSPDFRRGFLFGATHEVRTRDLNLGKVALYQLS